MKGRIILVGLVTYWGTLSACLATDFAGGTGEPNDPYQIATAEQLLAIGHDRDLLDKHYVLIADIDMNPNTPGCRVFGRALIAPSITDDFCGSAYTGASFTGTFDGRGHKIYGLRIHSKCFGSDYLGLFGLIGKAGVVRNLRVEDGGISAWECTAYIGVFAGANEGTILHCQSEGDIFYPSQLDYEPVGGFVGDNKGVIARCRATSRLSIDVAFDSIGGFAGNNNGLLFQCHADATITTGHRGEGPVGGLVGYNDGSISQCSATNDLDLRGYGRHGGLVGVNVGSIVQCFATGYIYDDGWGYVAGLVGRSYGPIRQCYAATRIKAEPTTEIEAGLVARTANIVTQCFWDVEESGQRYSDGGSGLTTAQMKGAQVFLDAGWDWSDERVNGMCEVWTLQEEGQDYPRFVWNSDLGYAPGFQGSGTAENPYRIVTATDLGSMSHSDLEAHYILAGDIDLTGTSWAGAVIPTVAGRLDGAGRLISNLNIQDLGHVGLVGAVCPRAEVVNIGVEAVNIAGTDMSLCVGGLAATNAGQIENCHISGSVAGGWYIGGLVGWNNGTVGRCFSTANVSGQTSIGGLVGRNEQAVTHSYAWGNVTGRDVVGGLVGLSEDIVTQCYAIGQVTGYWDVGLLVGLDTDTVSQCCYLQRPMVQGGAGMALNGSTMKRRGSFVDWDFDTVWTICENQGYPRLLWEGVSCSK